MIKLHNGDCLEVMRGLTDNSVDSIVTDPPYELGFMGKSWDSTGIANDATMWAECLRVLKPGGHLLAFSGTRTYHRMASAIEDAGFEVRDMIEWVYSTGFPKSLNIGKAVDKLQGNERVVIGKGYPMSSLGVMHDDNWKSDNSYSETKGNSEWEGWGTALKPAHEPICMARKPISEKTVAENCLKWGTGGINIDKSRVGMQTIKSVGGRKSVITGDTRTGKALGMNAPHEPLNTFHEGRFPANLIHDNSEEVRECFPETKNGGQNTTSKRETWLRQETEPTQYSGDSGNASRFFKSILYYPKASKSERNKGCEGLEEKERIDYGGFHSEKGLITNGRNPENRKPTTNNHPTVKPVKLMEYLIEMVTPENGTVLEPFMGSGTTGVACVNTNRNFIGIELDKDYFAICEKRIADAQKQYLQTKLAI